MEYIGFDYHKQYSFATSINSDTGEVRIAKLSNTPEAISSFIHNPEHTHAVLESSRAWPVLYRLLKDKTASIKLAHPLLVKAIASARIKTDKIDSRILAELLSADLIPEAHIRNEKNRLHQTIIRQRAFYVASRTRVKNRIGYLIDSFDYGVRSEVQGLSDLFGKAGKNWLNSVIIPQKDRLLLDQLLDTLDHLNNIIKESDTTIQSLLRDDSTAQCLATVPGIGPFLAVLISTEIDGIERFASAKKLASYTGLIPSTYASGGKISHGRITKQGNKWLRWALVEAAITAKKHNAQLNGFHTRLFKRLGKKKANVALARRLVTIIYSMLRDKRPFIEYQISNNYPLCYYASAYLICPIGLLFKNLFMYCNIV
ncbi:MAG: IS110 family transposase [bacterium]|nr:IS110 family transposase [bacterium]